MSIIKKSGKITIVVLATLFSTSMSFLTPSKTVDVKIENETRTIETKGETVEDVINELDLDFKPTKKEIKNKTLETEVKDNDTIEIKKQKTVTLVIGDKKEKVTTDASTIGELLEKQGRYNQKPYRSKVTNKLNDGIIIHLKEYEERNVSTVEVIPHEEEITYDYNMEYGKEKVTQEGKDGLKTVLTRALVINDKTISSINDSEVIEEPVQKKVIKGSKEIVKEKVKPEREVVEDSNVEYGKEVVKQKGEEGEKTITYKNEGKREKVKEEITKEPKNEIVAIGTKVSSGTNVGNFSGHIPNISSNAAKEEIARRESGGSYSARNGQYIGRYQLSSSYLNGDWSPENQERVADNYVAKRYGSWENALVFWNNNGWY